MQLQSINSVLNIKPETPIYTNNLRNGYGKFMTISSEVNRAPKTRDIGSEEVGTFLTEKIKGYEKLQQVYQNTRAGRFLESEVDAFNIDQFFRFQGLTCFEKLQFHRNGRFDKQYLLDQIELFFKTQTEVSILYYSGHGSEKNGEWEIVSKKDYVYQTEFVDLMDIAKIWQKRHRSQQLLVIISDSCYSEKMITKLKANNRYNDGTIAIQASCRSNQTSGDDDLGGFFTQDLLNTLRKNVYADLKLEIVGANFQSPVFYTLMSQKKYNELMEIPINFNSVIEMKDFKGQLKQNQQLRIQAMADQLDNPPPRSCEACNELQRKILQQQRDIVHMQEMIKRYSANQNLLQEQNDKLTQELAKNLKYINSEDYHTNNQKARLFKYQENQQIKYQRQQQELLKQQEDYDKDKQDENQLANFLCFSNIMKHQQLKLINATQVQSESFLNQYILTEQALTNDNQTYVLRFQLNKVFDSNGGIMLGIATKNIIEKQQYTQQKSYQELNHGIFAVNSNGYSFNSTNHQFNNTTLGLWKFGEAGNVVEVKIEMQRKKLTFRRMDIDDIHPFTMPFTYNKKESPIHGFAYLNGDCINLELIQKYKQPKKR